MKSYLCIVSITTKQVGIKKNIKHHNNNARKPSCKTCNIAVKFVEKFEPAEGFEPPSVTNYVTALLLSYTGLLLYFSN